MRLNGKNADGLHVEISENEISANGSSELVSARTVDHRSYYELEDHPVLEIDALMQFRTNLEVLTDLTARLAFLNREIRYVMKID
jgi:hypothetical protein